MFALPAEDGEDDQLEGAVLITKSQGTKTWTASVAILLTHVLKIPDVMADRGYDHPLPLCFPEL